MPGGIELTNLVESKSLFHSNMNILSIGFGTGEIECYLADNYNLKISGIDTDNDMVVKAKKKANAMKLSNKIQFEMGSGNNLKYLDRTFDIVFSIGSIVDFFDLGLSEIYRVLKYSGMAIIGEVYGLKMKFLLK